MAEKNKFEERELDERLDEQDEKSEHKTNYPGAKEESALESNNKHVIEFHNRLEEINEHAAFAFDNREDIGQYPATNRKEMIASHLEAFNSVEFHENANDRLDAAKDVAETVFEPLHKYIATNMLESQHNVNPKLVSAMEEEGIEHVEEMLARDASGNIALKFTVMDQETAERLVERFEGQLHIVTKEEAKEYNSSNGDKIIEDYQGKFADTLNLTDGKNEAAADAAAERLFEIFNEAHDYSRNQWTKEALEPKEVNADEFSELATLDEARRYMEVDRMLHGTWKELLEPINEMHWNMDPQYNGANEVYRTIEDVHANGIWATLEDQNYDNFKLISENIQNCKEEFSKAMTENTGFIKLNGYDQHVLPESFDSVEKANDYSDAMNAHLYQIRKENETSGDNESMSSMSYHIAMQMKENFNMKLQAIEETQSAGRDQTEEYASLYKTAQGLDYIMKSKEAQESDESGSLTEKATVAAKVVETAADVAVIAAAAL